MFSIDSCDDEHITERRQGCGHFLFEQWGNYFRFSAEGIAFVCVSPCVLKIDWNVFGDMNVFVVLWNGTEVAVDGENVVKRLIVRTKDIIKEMKLFSIWYVTGVFFSLLIRCGIDGGRGDYLNWGCVLFLGTHTHSEERLPISGDICNCVRWPERGSYCWLAFIWIAIVVWRTDGLNWIDVIYFCMNLYKLNWWTVRDFICTNNNLCRRFSCGDAPTWGLQGDATKL